MLSVKDKALVSVWATPHLQQVKCSYLTNASQTVSVCKYCPEHICASFPDFINMSVIYLLLCVGRRQRGK